jgi:hypothetical protein
MVNPMDPHSHILEFLDRSRYYFFQAAPKLYSRGWVGPNPGPLLLRKSGSAGNQTRTSESVAMNPDHYSTHVINSTCSSRQMIIMYTCNYTKATKTAVASFPSWWPLFNSWSDYVEFMVDKVALGMFSQNTSVFLPILSPQITLYSLFFPSPMLYNFDIYVIK